MEEDVVPLVRSLFFLLKPLNPLHQSYPLLLLASFFVRLHVSFWPQFLSHCSLFFWPFLNKQNGFFLFLISCWQMSSTSFWCLSSWSELLSITCTFSDTIIITKKNIKDKWSIKVKNTSCTVWLLVEVLLDAVGTVVLELMLWFYSKIRSVP